MQRIQYRCGLRDMTETVAGDRNDEVGCFEHVLTRLNRTRLFHTRCEHVAVYPGGESAANEKNNCPSLNRYASITLKLDIASFAAYDAGNNRSSVKNNRLSDYFYRTVHAF